MLEQLFLLAFDHRRSLMDSFFDVRGEPSRRTKRTHGSSSSLSGRTTEGIEQGSLAIGRRPRRRDVRSRGDRRGARDGFASRRRRGERAQRVRVRDAWLEGAARRARPDLGEGARPLQPGRRHRCQRATAPGARRGLGSLPGVGRGFLFELLGAPRATPARRVDGGRYDVEVRPDLMVRAIASSSEPGSSRISGRSRVSDRSEDCEAVAASARGGGRDHVGCVVLGRGADTEAVDRWLRAAAGVPGFIGFAIGRSIWWEPLRGFFDAGAADAASKLPCRRSPAGTSTSSTSSPAEEPRRPHAPRVSSARGRPARPPGPRRSNPDLVLSGDIAPAFGQVERLVEQARFTSGDPPRSSPPARRGSDSASGSAAWSETTSSVDRRATSSPGATSTSPGS